MLLPRIRLDSEVLWFNCIFPYLQLVEILHSAKFVSKGFFRLLDTDVNLWKLVFRYKYRLDLDETILQESKAFLFRENPRHVLKDIIDNRVFTVAHTRDTAVNSVKLERPKGNAKLLLEIRWSRPWLTKDKRSLCVPTLKIKGRTYQSMSQGNSLYISMAEGEISQFQTSFIERICEAEDVMVLFETETVFLNYMLVFIMAATKDAPQRESSASEIAVDYVRIRRQPQGYSCITAKRIYNDPNVAKYHAYFHINDFFGIYMRHYCHKAVISIPYKLPANMTGVTDVHITINGPSVMKHCCFIPSNYNNTTDLVDPNFRDQVHVSYFDAWHIPDAPISDCRDLYISIPVGMTVSITIKVADATDPEINLVKDGQITRLRRGTQNCYSGLLSPGRYTIQTTMVVLEIEGSPRPVLHGEVPVSLFQKYFKEASIRHSLPIFSLEYDETAELHFEELGKEIAKVEIFCLETAAVIELPSNTKRFSVATILDIFKVKRGLFKLTVKKSPEASRCLFKFSACLVCNSKIRGVLVGEEHTTIREYVWPLRERDVANLIHIAIFLHDSWFRSLEIQPRIQKKFCLEEF